MNSTQPLRILFMANVLFVYALSANEASNPQAVIDQQAYPTFTKSVHRMTAEVGMFTSNNTGSCDSLENPALFEVMLNVCLENGWAFSRELMAEHSCYEGSGTLHFECSSGCDSGICTKDLAEFGVGGKLGVITREQTESERIEHESGSTELVESSNGALAPDLNASSSMGNAERRYIDSLK